MKIRESHSHTGFMVTKKKKKNRYNMILKAGQ